MKKIAIPVTSQNCIEYLTEVISNRQPEFPRHQWDTVGQHYKAKTSALIKFDFLVLNHELKLIILL